MKLFVFSDVHGFYDELKTALDNAGFEKDNPEHMIVSLGDLLDRGKQPLECLRFVNSIPDERKILVCGNHEILLQECLEEREFFDHDYHNGTVFTVLRLSEVGEDTMTESEQLWISASENPEWIKYRDSVVDYAEIGDYIFVHGWIPCNRDDQNKYHARNVKYSFDENWSEGNWDNAMWINGMDAWRQGVRVPGKTIFCGHWHTSWGHSKIHKTGPEWDNLYTTNPEHRFAHFEPFKDDGICAIDACTAVSHKVNVVTLEV